ncbi:MAG: hypothetical protein KGI05_05070 [Thaumarchaeota archaeon]|nr:hypothetical protein [Nitrososphaerota archaeon]
MITHIKKGIRDEEKLDLVLVYYNLDFAMDLIPLCMPFVQPPHRNWLTDPFP